MSNIKIWHNPKCSKSRNTLALLEDQAIGRPIENIIELLKG